MNFKAPPEINEDTPGCHQTSAWNPCSRKWRSELIKTFKEPEGEMHADMQAARAQKGGSFRCASYTEWGKGDHQNVVLRENF